MTTPSTRFPHMSINPRTLDRIRSLDGLAYLASPYTGYAPPAPRVPDTLGEAAWRAALASGVLTAHGLPHFCPIAHSHWVALAAGLNPRDHELWMPHCHAHMERCAGIVVLMLPGWRTSKGVTEERRWFSDRGLPEILWSPPDVEV